MGLGGGLSLQAAAPIFAAAALCTLASCSGDEDRSDGGSPTSSPSPAPTLAPARLVVGRYPWNFRERRVRTTVAPTLITRSRRNDYSVVPPGKEEVQIDVRLEDTGRDRLDLTVLRFGAVDDAGRRVREALRLAPRKVEPQSRSSPRIVSVGFMLRRGSRVVALTMRSNQAALPIRLRWKLVDAGH